MELAPEDVHAVSGGQDNIFYMYIYMGGDHRRTTLGYGGTNKPDMVDGSGTYYSGLKGLEEEKKSSNGWGKQNHVRHALIILGISAVPLIWTTLILSSYGQRLIELF